MFESPEQPDSDEAVEDPETAEGSRISRAVSKLGKRIAEAARSVTGVHFEDRSPEEVAEAIERLKENPLTRPFGEAIQKRRDEE